MKPIITRETQFVFEKINTVIYLSIVVDFIIIIQTMNIYLIKIII